MGEGGKYESWIAKLDDYYESPILCDMIDRMTLTHQEQRLHI